MGRSEIPLDPSDGPLAAFACGLRELRKQAGGRSYRELARKAHFSASTLSIAAGGRTLPSLPVVQGFVRACGGDVEEWTGRWHELSRLLDDGTGPQPAADQEALASGWERVRRISRDELEPGDLVVTSGPEPFLVFVGDDRVVDSDVWPGREPAWPIPDPGSVEAYIRGGPSFFAEAFPATIPEAAASTAEHATLLRPEPEPSREPEGAPPPPAGPGRPRVPRRPLLLLAAVAGLAIAGYAVWPADGGAGRPKATPSPTPSATQLLKGVAQPSSPAPGTEVLAGPGCPVVQGTSIAANNSGDTWKEVGGGPVECGGHALAAWTTTSTTVVHSTYTWTMRTVAARCVLQIYVADANPSSATAHYVVYGSSGLLGQFDLDQAGNKGRWVKAGTWSAPGGVLKLVLTDQADYTGAHHHVTAAAASFTCA